MRVEKEQTEEGLKIQIWLAEEDLVLYDTVSLFHPVQPVLLQSQEAERKKRYCLIRMKNKERIFLTKPMFRIGREQGKVDYCISDNRNVSRNHAAILIQRNEVFLVNAASKNHTYVNGRQVPDHVKIQLTSGDRIHLANEEFMFCLVEELV